MVAICHSSTKYLAAVLDIKAHYGNTSQQLWGRHVKHFSYPPWIPGTLLTAAFLRTVLAFRSCTVLLKYSAVRRQSYLNTDSRLKSWENGTSPVISMTPTPRCYCMSLSQQKWWNKPQWNFTNHWQIQETASKKATENWSYIVTLQTSFFFPSPICPLIPNLPLKHWNISNHWQIQEITIK